MDAPGNDGNASMPEQVKRPNPWRKMTMMMTTMVMMMMTLHRTTQLTTLVVRLSGIRTQSSQTKSNGAQCMPCAVLCLTYGHVS